MSRLLISAAHKSSGKTTITLGLCAALTGQGLKVQPFKKGPDYIDPMWLSQASGRDCFNLDPYLMSGEQIQSCYGRASATSDISIVEGNKGLYDGLALDGSNSNAALAHLLDLPVILVLDARGMTRGIAPLILGYQAFDPRIKIAGVVLNQLGGARHESKLRAVIEHYTDVQVLGAVGCDPLLAVQERHLGLMPNHELDDARQRVCAIGERIAAQVDLPRLLQVAASAAPMALPATSAEAVQPDLQKVRIGVARDKAFGFYYSDDLQVLEQAGAEIVPFDTLHDQQLPPVDGLFIGGGFPEVFMAELAANISMRTSIRAAIEDDLPVYAECGGMMYLARSIRWHDKACEMVGALPADVQMHPRPVGRGYVELKLTGEAPWSTGSGEEVVRGHEFHYSSLENISADLKFAYRVQRGHGVDGQNDGIVYRNVLASYAHLRSGAGSDWAKGFVSFVRSQKASSDAALADSTSPTQSIEVNGRPIATDMEGYLVHLNDWSEEFAQAQARQENLKLTDSHWEVIRFLRDHFDEHRVQAQVRTMIKHFASAWGTERGNNHQLHALFPIGGPQKQGNRLAGLWKTKGEH
ncbi:cobyrinate a,c-diamide synthase [Rhodoferax sp.]|uniref:cobyrinate a,c-diamide synthase n=1 Tax=Rhodoferax sp. TaxID=50421 RepID=UPI00283FC656|nr:cobyrinate a,c-diamide synthase [Rhodoferax sp.]MDR3370501.1 cobyrinate a,c-diamide synthase [Rhodoferax sp.]